MNESDAQSGQSAYQHQADIPGRQSGSGAQTEHRESADPDAPERNELTPDERGRTDGDGPRTHDSLRTTRKD